MRRAAVLYNPVSGAGRAGAMAEAAARVLAAEGWTVERVATSGPGEAEPLARDRARDVDLLVVAGGDGSIREAVAGLGGESRRVPVAILPCGNANVVARELGIPRDEAGALALLTTGEPVPIDLGRMQGQVFLAMVGVGWDARTVHALARLRGTRLGGAWYRLWADSAWLLAGFLAVLVWPLQRLRLRADGAPAPSRYCAVQIANFRCYGKGWALVPDARPASGRLHFQGRKRAGPLFIVWQLLAAMLGRRVPRLVSDYGDARRLVVEADHPFAVQTDGDDRGRFGRIEIEIEPGAARVLAPRR